MQTDLALMIIDDDDRFRERLKLSFTRRGYHVEAFSEGASAIEYAHHHHIELALVDLRLEGEWGLNIVRSLLTINPSFRIVILTAYGSIATALEALKIGATHYLQKPVSVDEIEQALLKEQEPDLAQEQSACVLSSKEKVRPSLATIEWEYINRVLTEHDGNISITAQVLGMHRRTLQRKLAKFPTKT